MSLVAARPCARLIVLLACVLSFADPSWAYDSCGWWFKSELRRAVLDRARRVRPAIRNAPARELNIGDDEVREIQAEIEPVVGHVTVSIGTVVTGCPCEETSLCTDQVWVYAYRDHDTVGLQLSRVSGHWKIGVVQQWWMDHEELERQPRRSFRETDAALGQHIDQFPKCGLDPRDIQWIHDRFGTGCK